MRMNVLAGLATLLVAACSPKGFEIEGNLTGDVEGRTVYLYTGSELLGTREVRDSTVIRDGHFVFRGEASAPSLLTMKIYPADGDRRMMDEKGFAFRPVIPLFIGEGKVQIEAALDKIPLESFEGKYDYSGMRIMGPEQTTRYVDYTHRMNALKEKYAEANQDYIAYLRAQGKAPVSEGIRAVDQTDAADAEMVKFARDFILNNANSAIGLYALEDNISQLLKSLFTAPEIDELLAAFPKKIKESEYGQNVLRKAEKVRQSAVGAKYVDVVLQDTLGNDVKLSDCLPKGKYVLLEFWASHCGPCKADIPHLKEVYSLYNPEGFEVISISTDAKREAWLKEMRKQQMQWLQLAVRQNAGEEIMDAYNFRGIPFCVLVAPDGTIVSRNLRGSWMDREVVKLYGNKFGEKY